MTGRFRGGKFRQRAIQTHECRSGGMSERSYRVGSSSETRHGQEPLECLHRLRGSTLTTTEAYTWLRAELLELCLALRNG